MTNEQTALIAKIKNDTYSYPESPDWGNDESVSAFKEALQEKKTELEGLAELPDLPTGGACYIACAIAYVICRMAGTSPEDEAVCRMNKIACNNNCGTAE